MRRVPLALLCLASLALPALATPALEVGFGLPAQADGDLGAAGPRWAHLLLHGGGSSFSVALEPGGSAANHTQAWIRAGPSSPPLTPGAHDVLPAQPLPEAVRGELTFLPGAWASLYVEADRLEVEALRSHASLGRAEAGANVDAYLPAQGPTGTFRAAAHQVADPGAWTAWQGERGTPIPVRLRAEGLRAIEWHNGTLACADSGACPAGGGVQETPLGGGGNALVTRSYVELRAPGGTLLGNGEAFLLALGGPSFDLAVAGRLRLPEADLRGTCPAGPCPEVAGRTLLATGNLTLSGLGVHPSDPHRLQAGLGGDVGTAALDEAPTLAFGPAAAVAVGAALVALPLLVKLLLALFARSARPPALQHPKRQQLHDLVRNEPGLSFRSIQRRLGWPHGTLANHMARLLDVRLVVARPYRNTVRFFENHGRYDATWGEAVLLRDPNLRGLHAWLLEHPRSTQGDVLEHCAAAGWKRSTTQDRLRALAEGGLLESTKEGRRILYSARQGRLDPATLLAVPEPAAVTPQ